MPKYYLRVEAVNLSNFVYDTDKIQPMRGGSYLLLESVHNLSGGSIHDGVTLEKVSAGASIGLFKFQLENNEDPEKVADSARKALNKTTGNHATFVVNVLKASAADDFVKDNETLVAMNRWQQFQQPTLMLPGIPEKEAQEKCAYDGVRPGVANSNTPDGKISSSVYFRKEEGGKLRSTIYRKILRNDIYSKIFENNSSLDKFTGDLDTLSRAPSKKNLSGKMALIYLDGNKFTKIRNETCKNPETLTKFDKRVQGARNKFLEELLKKSSESLDFNTGDKIRLELLLWGGDEIELVVPAWKGWDVLKLFYETTKDMTFKGEEPGSPTYSLTHATGIIFCNHKAPIRQVRNMARILADIAKEEINKNIIKLKEKIPKEENKNDIEYLNHKAHDISRHLVLESFDMVGADVRNFVGQYYGGGYKALSFTPEGIKQIEEALSSMKFKGFPRNKIYEIVQVVKKNETSEELDNLPQEVNDIYKRGLSEISDPENTEIKEAIDAAINNNPQRWFLMADLWDYVEASHD